LNVKEASRAARPVEIGIDRGSVLRMLVAPMVVVPLTLFFITALLARGDPLDMIFRGVLILGLVAVLASVVYGALWNLRMVLRRGPALRLTGSGLTIRCARGAPEGETPWADIVDIALDRGRDDDRPPSIVIWLPPSLKHNELRIEPGLLDRPYDKVVEQIKRARRKDRQGRR
jgi:hypothetical protein